MEENLKKILLVEDDPNFGTVLKEYLSLNGYEVVHAKNGPPAVHPRPFKIKTHHFSLFFTEKTGTDQRSWT